MAALVDGLEHGAGAVVVALGHLVDAFRQGQVLDRVERLRHGLHLAADGDGVGVARRWQSGDVVRIDEGRLRQQGHFQQPIAIKDMAGLLEIGPLRLRCRA